MKKSLLALSFSLLASSSAFAANSLGLFVEPMLTYERGEAEVDFPEPFGSSDSEIDGFGVGARLGLHVVEAVFIGIDGRYSLPQYKNSDMDMEAKATSYNYGPVVGVQMPTDLGIRVWAGYIMGGAMDVEKDQGLDLKFKDASGYRVGAGVKIAIVSLNLEYQQIKYDETEVQDSGVFTGSSNNVTQDNSSYVLSVSFPISL